MGRLTDRGAIAAVAAPSRRALPPRTVCAEPIKPSQDGTHQHGQAYAVAVAATPTATMECAFTRIDPRTHRFTVERPPHAQVAVVLETRSLLLHDLCHYAVESAMGTEGGFYGRLAEGWSLDALRDGRLAGADLDAMMGIERRVAMLQSAFRKGREGHDPEAWRRLRAVWGAWRKVRQGEQLVLVWPPGPPEVRGDR